MATPNEGAVFFAMVDTWRSWKWLLGIFVAQQHHILSHVDASISTNLAATWLVIVSHFTSLDNIAAAGFSFFDGFQFVLNTYIRVNLFELVSKADLTLS